MINGRISLKLGQVGSCKEGKIVTIIITIITIIVDNKLMESYKIIINKINSNSLPKSTITCHQIITLNVILIIEN